MIITKNIIYSLGATNAHGYLAYDDQLTTPQPCVMIAPDWRGRGDAACEKARQLAAMGYIGFAIDMYGEAKLGLDDEQRRALMTPLIQNRPLLANHILAAFKTACSRPQVDGDNVAASGFCFGGLCVLDLARSGAALKGVVSLHGLLSAPTEMPNQAIKAKMLVLHGYDDPLVPPEQVLEFAQEMTRKKVDWQVHMYGLTTHAFSNPEATDASSGLLYNKTADERSWASTTLFLEEIF